MKKRMLITSLISIITPYSTSIISLANNTNNLNQEFNQVQYRILNINKKGKVVNVASNDTLNVRAGISVKHKVLFTLKNNTEVYIKSQQSNGWYEIEYNGKVGFVNNKYIEINKNNNTTSNQYKTTADINLRKTASWSSEIVAVSKKNSLLNVIEINGNWAKVLYNGSIVYVPKSYLISFSNDNNSPEDIPILPEVPNVPDDSIEKDENENTDLKQYKLKMDLNLRASNSWSSKIITVIKKDTIVKAISINNEWVEVVYNGNRGYLPLSHLTKHTENTQNPVQVSKIATVNTDGLNVRTGPGVSYSSISKLYSNNIVLIKEKSSNGWYKIESITGITGWCSGSYLKNIREGSLPKIEDADKAIESVINIAKKQLGKPYLWGGNGPDAFDCSGLMVYSYKHGANISLPRDSYMQAEFGQTVKKEDLKPGDLVFFDTMNKGRVSHVGLYLGDNKMLHAPNKTKPVEITNIDTEAWNKIYITARRIIPN